MFTSYFNCYSFPSGSLGLKRDRKAKTKESPLKRRGERRQFQSSNLTEQRPQLRSSLSESNFLPNLLLLDTDLLSSWREKILPMWVRMELIFLLQSPSPACLGIWFMAGIEDIG